MNKGEFVDKIKEEIVKQEKKLTLFRSMSDPVSPDNAIGRVSRMDAINNKSVVDAALREAEERLKKLHNVLEGVYDADFGICQKCGKQILLGRLLIRPESILCVNCAK